MTDAGSFKPGLTCLVAALANESAEDVRRYLAAGGDIHAVDRDGNNALHILVDREIQESLLLRDVPSGPPTRNAILLGLQFGINPKAANDAGLTPLDWAEDDHPGAAQLLRAYG